MKIFLATLSLISLLSVSLKAQEVIPPEVKWILAQVAKIKRGDTLDVFFARSHIKIDKDVKIIGGTSSLGEDGVVWQIGKEGKWIMCTTSYRGIDKTSGDLKGELGDGQVVGVRVYYRKKVTKEINYDKMKRQLPYFQGYKLYKK